MKLEFKRTDSGILYLYDYYPSRYAEHNGVSENILKFKDNDDYAVAFLCTDIKGAIDVYFKKRREALSDAIVCIVPSHEKDIYSDALKFLASSVCDEFGCKNAWNLILRTKTHEKLSGGGDRSVKGLLDTMALYAGYNLTDKMVVVFDDITTTGNTMEAVKRLLKEKGVKDIYAITLGRTCEGTAKTDLQNDEIGDNELDNTEREQKEEKKDSILPISSIKYEKEYSHELGAKYSVLLCGQSLSEYLDSIKKWIDYGIKVLWFGDAASVEALKGIDNSKKYIKARLLQVFVVSGYKGIVIDGNDESGLISRLESACPSFNAAQYRVEHCSPDEHIVVQASAGTGKTSVMIDRIMYLMHTVPGLHMYDIYMITFTNDATEEMNRRLQDNLLNRYHLTGNVKYFRWVEEQSQMNISTIHSFSYEVLRKYGIKQGFTGNLCIKSFKKDRNDLIFEYMDNLLETDSSIKDQVGEQYYTTKALIDMFWDECAKVGLSHEAIHNLKWGETFPNEESNKFGKFAKEIIPKLDDEFFEVKRKMDAISLSDIIRDLQMVLGEFIKQKERDDASESPLSGLGMKYLFIDEFQDTDLSQIDVANQLVKLTGTKLFVVGDVKQSIYGFRGANDEAFQTLYKALDGNGNCTGHIDFSLKNNYRTAEALMQSMDKIFARWGSSEMLKYDAPVVPLNKDACGGLIIYHCLEPEKPDGVILSESEEDKEKTEDFFERRQTLFEDPSQPSAREIAENTQKALDDLMDRVEKLKEAGKKIDEKFRVVLLTRTNGQLDQLSMLLRKHKIPNVTKREGYFYKSEAVRDFYALICSFLFENEPKHMFNFLMTPYAGDVGTIDIKAMEALNGDKEQLCLYLSDFIRKTKWDNYRNGLRLRPIISVLKDIVEQIPVVENFIVNTRRALLDDGWDEENAKAVTYARASQYKANLEKLIELIQSNFSDERLSLYVLYVFLKSQIATNREEEEPETRNDNDYKSVLCVTTHKSKGLEFDTIILPYTGKKLSTKERMEMIIDTKDLRVGWNGGGLNFQNEFYTDMHEMKVFKDRAEEHRILYVAMTRAINKLIVIEPMRPKEDTWASYIGL